MTKRIVILMGLLTSIALSCEDSPIELAIPPPEGTGGGPPAAGTGGGKGEGAAGDSSASSSSSKTEASSDLVCLTRNCSGGDGGRCSCFASCDDGRLLQTRCDGNGAECSCMINGIEVGTCPVGPTGSCTFDEVCCNAFFKDDR